MSNFITTYDSMDAPDTSGTHLKDYLPFGITYDMLVDYLGEPTFLPEDSGDGKVNFEWVVEFNDELFTIYDWKVEPEWSKINTGNLNQDNFYASKWHVGGKTYAGNFVDFLSEEILKSVA